MDCSIMCMFTRYEKGHSGMGLGGLLVRGNGISNARCPSCVGEKARRGIKTFAWMCQHGYWIGLGDALGALCAPVSSSYHFHVIVFTKYMTPGFFVGRSIGNSFPKKNTISEYHGCSTMVL